MDQALETSQNLAPWRRPAPLARKATRLLYEWRDPKLVFFVSLLGAAPFLIAAGLAPALLSFASTIDMIAPIASARAVSTGAVDIQSVSEPLFLYLLLSADLFADAPGRVHLLAKMFAAAMVVIPLAWFLSVRLPVIQTVIVSAGVAGFVAAPFADTSELSLALFMTIALCFISAPAEASAVRARFEGGVSGVLLFALWMLSPLFSLAGFIALSACPFLGGRSGVMRYAFAMASFMLLAGAAEIAAPGLNFTRADAASALLSDVDLIKDGFGTASFIGVAASTAAVLFLSTVFGGGAHARGWGAALVFLGFSLTAAALAGASPWPLFIAASCIACFSTQSPFYDGVFRHHDRASIAVAGSAAALTTFWTLALTAQMAGQFVLQERVAKTAPEHIRTEFALVQPEGPTVAQWLEEGRFSTSEARVLFSLAPVDQSEVLLAAVAEARALTKDGHEVAILTGADVACIFIVESNCYADGTAAAGAANVVLAPRLDLDPATVLAKGRAEALLYSEFKLVNQSALWEMWVRRDAPSLQSLTAVTPCLGRSLNYLNATIV